MGISKFCLHFSLGILKFFAGTSNFGIARPLKVWSKTTASHTCLVHTSCFASYFMRYLTATNRVETCLGIQRCHFSVFKRVSIFFTKPKNSVFLIVRKKKGKNYYLSGFFKKSGKKIQRGFLEIAFRNWRKGDGNTICSTGSTESVLSKGAHH